MMVAAQGQTGDSPANATYIDNLPRTIPAITGMWFKFDYNAADRSITTITLVDGNTNHVRFQVWTLDAVKDTANNKPVGAGTAPNVPCDTGTCQSNDLTWVGAFGIGGTFYVDIINDNTVPTIAWLLIQGAGVSLGTPLPPPTAVPVATDTSIPPTAVPLPSSTGAPATSASAPTSAAPTSTSAPTSATPTNTNVPPTTAPPAPTNTSPAETPTPAAMANVDDPALAIAIDGALHKIAANSALWFSFDYGPNDDNPRPVRTITLVNGSHSGVRFEVWTPDHINNWWDNQKPVGRGTVSNIDCETGEPSETGQCQSNDLTWMGAFNIGGRYYVRVVNDNPQPTTFQLTIN